MKMRIMPSTPITIGRETLTATAWAERLGTPVQTIIGRVQRGWDKARACTEPIRSAPATKGLKLPAEPLTKEEIEQLLKACSKRGACGFRMRAMIVVAWRAGLRCAEVTGLYPRDLDRGHGMIRIRHGKGDKCRVVGMDPLAWEVLATWMERRSKLGMNASNPVFCTHSGKELDASAVRGAIRRLAKKAGITKRVHFHALRHSHAFELANEGTPMHIIMQQLGHANLTETSRYIRHLNPQEVIQRMQSRKWGSG